MQCQPPQDTHVCTGLVALRVSATFQPCELTRVVWGHTAQDVASAACGSMPPVALGCLLDVGLRVPTLAHGSPGRFLGPHSCPASPAEGRRAPADAPARPASATGPGGYSWGHGVETPSIYSKVVQFL